MRSVKKLFEYLFLRPTEDTLVQLFRYVFVGGTAFVADFGSLYLLTEYAGLHYLVSATIAFVIGLAVNYLFSTLWVFQARKVRNPYMEFLFFALIGVVGLGLNTLIMYVFTDLLAVYYLLSKIISTFLVFMWNFLARKYLLFNPANK